MDLTLVTSIRNMDYGGDPKQGGRVFQTGVAFQERLRRAVKANLELLDDSAMQYEWILVDWCSPERPFCFDPRTDRLLAHPRIRNILVSEEVGRSEKLSPPSGFFEHFAKNVGLRQARGRYVLIVNADIVLDRALVDEIARVVQSEDHAHYYRPSTHVDVDPNTDEILKTVDLTAKFDEKWDKRWSNDGFLAANYAGNFLLATRRNLVEVAQGFDETNRKHRQEYWHRSGMDGEILWNLWRRAGVEVSFLKGGYTHLFHGKPPEGMEYNQAGYQNHPEWGLTRYPIVHRQANVWQVTLP